MPSTLVCDVTAAPVGLVPMTEAVSHVALGKAQSLVVDEERRFRSMQLDLPAPVVIGLPVAVPLTAMQRKTPTRRVIVARDGYRCQYCGCDVTLRSGQANTATIDHVKPRSRFPRPGDAHTWENVTTACASCNRRKADKLPMECGMYPRRTPRQPNYVAARWAGRLRTQAHVEWVADYYRLDPQLLRAR